MPTKEKSKESYYERNRRQRLAYQKAYYWKNKEKIIEKRKNKEKNDPKEIQKRRTTQRHITERTESGFSKTSGNEEEAVKQSKMSGKIEFCAWKSGIRSQYNFHKN